MSEEDKNRGVAVVVDHHHQHHQHHHHHHDQPTAPPPPQYGTFQGVANYPPPAVGFPEPVPPAGAAVHGSSAPSPQYYPHGYQAVQGYAVAEGIPARERRLPCCGLGLGWCLFIIGFFLGTIPWYIGLLVLMCGRIDHREKPGFIACTVAAVLATIAIVLGATKGAHDW